MQQPRNFDDIKFSSIHRRIMLWGSGGPFLDGYVLVMIGVALEQLTPALKLDAQWLGLLGGRHAGRAVCRYVAVRLYLRQSGAT
ncbi:major facilitator superfamily protein [Citrobacter koseri]|nr:major facilitator superfamily protein [Citrobacter koseri]